MKTKINSVERWKILLCTEVRLWLVGKKRFIVGCSPTHKALWLSGWISPGAPTPEVVMWCWDGDVTRWQKPWWCHRRGTRWRRVGGGRLDSGMKAEKERGLLKVNTADWLRMETCQVLGLDRDNKRVVPTGKTLWVFPPGFSLSFRLTQQFRTSVCMKINTTNQKLSREIKKTEIDIFYIRPIMLYSNTKLCFLNISFNWTVSLLCFSSTTLLCSSSPEWSDLEFYYFFKLRLPLRLYPPICCSLEIYTVYWIINCAKPLRWRAGW